MGLLSRGSHVRALPGTPFPKEFADFSLRENRWRMFIEQSDQSRKFAPQLRECAISAFPFAILRGTFSSHRRNCSTMSLITGLACQATGEPDPLPTLKLTLPIWCLSSDQREPAAPASAHSDP